jgi:hypothetical protein
MLPPDFRWIKPAATAYDETVIAHGDTWVVHIYQPERGREWVAMLDAHREPEGRMRIASRKAGGIGAAPPLPMAKPAPSYGCSGSRRGFGWRYRIGWELRGF